MKSGGNQAYFDQWDFFTEFRGYKTKNIIKCFYQLVFRFDQFLDCKLTYLWIIFDFVILTPFIGPFPPYGAFFHTLRLNKENLTTIECLKCIIKCLYQLVFKFSHFFYLKLTRLLNYWRFIDFDPFTCAFFHLNFSSIG